MAELTSEQRAAKDISALQDSVWVIDQMLAIESPSDEDIEAISRNAEHIELMLTKQHILDSGVNLEPFEEAVLRARA